MSKPIAIAFTLDSDLELSITASVARAYVNNRYGGFSETCSDEVEDLHVELIFGSSRINITKSLSPRDLDAIVEMSLKEASHD